MPAFRMPSPCGESRETSDASSPHQLGKAEIEDSVRMRTPFGHNTQTQLALVSSSSLALHRPLSHLQESTDDATKV